MKALVRPTPEEQQSSHPRSQNLDWANSSRSAAPGRLYWTAGQTNRVSMGSNWRNVGPNQAQAFLN